MKKHKLICLFLVSLCLLLNCITASAANTGSLRILDVEKPVTLYHVADLDGNRTETFRRAPKADLLDETANAKNAKKYQRYVRWNQIAGWEAAPDATGQILFSPLEEGIYLVCSPEKEFDPFFLRMPTKINSTVQYDIEAKPKGEPPTEPSEPTKPTWPDWPDWPTEPTCPSEPTWPTCPTIPTCPTEPLPTIPTCPTEPSEPTQPSKPTEPSDPTQPSEPTEPSDPTNPSEPTDPSVPTEPTIPTEPSEPEPEPEIPQTGSSVWPKYSALAAGILLVLAGFADLIRGREQEA